MKVVYGYQPNGQFVIITVQDDGLSEDVDQMKKTIDAVTCKGESYVEIPRAVCQKISKLMQFGKTGEIRITDTSQP